MISKGAIKRIKALGDKKYRSEYGLFVAEGDKVVKELCISKHLKIKDLYATHAWLDKNYKTVPDNIEVTVITNGELERISFLKTPNAVLATIQIPENKIKTSDLAKHSAIVLDNIKDPGNLGTIIRIADWFGINHIICSEETVDVYNPKVIQATMGSICRVNVVYLDLLQILEQVSTKIHIYGTFLSGKNIYETQFKEPAWIVIGSESHGISQNLAPIISNRITIPSFSNDSNTAESLNASIATSIVCSELKRNTFTSKP